MMGTYGEEDVRNELFELEKTLQSKQDEARNDYQRLRTQLLNPLLNKFDRVMNDVALENGVDVVLNQPTTPRELTEEIGENKIIDLTDIAIERLTEY